MKGIGSLEQLKTVALAIDSELTVRWRQFDKEEVLKPFVAQHLEKMYNIHNDIIAFNSGGVRYVIPYTTEIEDLLETEGLVRHKALYVPFSSQDYPVEKEKEWEDIKKMFEN